MKGSNRRWYLANRARALRNGYRQADERAGRKITITVDQIAAIIDLPCHYCRTVDRLRGLDRIENSVGHQVGNVLPCCHTCNMVRNDLFSVDEMEQIGETIRRVMDARLG